MKFTLLVSDLFTSCSSGKSRQSLIALAAIFIALPAIAAGGSQRATFNLEEASVKDIRDAMEAGALTSKQLVQLYLARIAAYEDGGP